MKVCCGKIYCHFSWQTCDEDNAKVSCCEARSMKMLLEKAMRGYMVVRCIVRALLVWAVRR